MAKIKEMKKVAEPIIVAGFESGKNENDILADLFATGQIEFGFLQKIFKEIAIDKELIIDPKIVKANITAQVEESQWDSISSFEQIEACCDAIVEEVKGADAKGVMVAIRKYFRDNELEMPKKAAKAASTRKRGGKVVEAVVALFNEHQKPTKQDLYEAILPHVKGPENALYYTNQYHTMAFALGNSMSLADAAKETADMAVELPETEDSSNE